MGRRGTVVAAVLAAFLMTCGSLTDVGSAPEPQPTPLPTPAPTSGANRPEIRIDPLNGQSIVVHVDGPDSATITATLYRDGVLFGQRSAIGSRSGLSQTFAPNGSPAQRLEGTPSGPFSNPPPASKHAKPTSSF